nr:MAG TPA: hypothetical protein [Caudoviricetes sp.]
MGKRNFKKRGAKKKGKKKSRIFLVKKNGDSGVKRKKTFTFFFHSVKIR